MASSIARANRRFGYRPDYLLPRRALSVRRLGQAFFEALDGGEFQAITSILTLTEVLIHPLRANDSKLAARYRETLLDAENLSVFAMTEDIAEEAARVRATTNLRVPDAIQWATATRRGATFFLTNDRKLSKLSGIAVINLQDVNHSK
ncbi:MAG: type II toxin-antitoxin system VapC family toxin [Pirellulales bacterium]